MNQLQAISKATEVAEKISKIRELQKEFACFEENKKRDLAEQYRKIEAAFSEYISLILRQEDDQMVERVSSGNLPYYCEHCKKIHNGNLVKESDRISGDRNEENDNNTGEEIENKIYNEHLTYAHEFPIMAPDDIEIPEPYEIYEMEVVGVYYTGNGDYMNSLSRGTLLELNAEPNNPYDSTAVSVWHGGLKLGYLPGEDNKVIFSALEDDLEVVALFGSYSPSEVVENDINDFYQEFYTIDDLKEALYESREFYPERGYITIKIINIKQIEIIFKFLMKLLKLVKNSYAIPFAKEIKRMGKYGLKFLEREIAKSHEIPLERQLIYIMDEISQQFKVNVGNYSIFL